MQKFQNLYRLLENTVNLHGDSPAYYEQEQGQWQEITWIQLKEQVDRFGMALLKQGLQSGQAVSVLSSNNLLWPVSDLGTIAAGGICAGLYPSSSPDQCVYIINHSGSKFVIVDSVVQLQKILQVEEQIPQVKYIVVREQAEIQYDNPKIILWDDFLKFGDEYRQDGWQKYQDIACNRDWEDIVIIVYTSGTTGRPKGACLSNRYVIASCEALYKLSQDTLEQLPKQILKNCQDELMVNLSYLPYCHVGERISGMYNRLYSGIAAYSVNDITKLYPQMLEVNPHFFGSLPRFYEKIYAKVLNEVETEKGYSQKDFQRAIDINRKACEYRQQGKEIPEDLAEEMDWADIEIGQKVRANFGKRIIACSSGAAPIPQEVLEMFEYAGNLKILEGYGLTEFVCCAFSTPNAQKPGSVGRPMYGCEVNIAEDGEILLKGPQMFSGYYHDQKATDETIDKEGWLHTGDIGKLDEDGFLFITGRKKEFIKTSTGKKIAPLYIENLCKRNHLISNIMVYGDNKNYLTALITLNEMELQAYATFHKLENRDNLAKHPKIIDLVEKAIADANEKVSRTEQIKKYTILPRDFSIEENEITPTGKVKRKVVTEKYQDVIESMYS